MDRRNLGCLWESLIFSEFCPDLTFSRFRTRLIIKYSLKEVAQHDGKDGANVWIVIYDMVYDVTEYKDKHPGGPELIEEYAGQDATRGFDEFGHSSDAKRMLKKFLVGELVEDDKVRNRRKKNDNTVEINPEIRSGRRRFLSVLCFKCVT
ncbi:PREDICTED: cytochrome b5 isoform X2 [Eufriesea mexicana]|uniref:cytochrome b5 isoform X2 n=1 Tax=Eufriesea mexicana TaxID=516756 RepID=UPI00083C2537|nr:PREDICTED: cytochrome b5 isoform X2 [Eufriesea mexicana]